MKTLSSPIYFIKKSIEIFFKKQNMVYFLKINLILIPFYLLSLVNTYLVNNKVYKPDDFRFATVLAVVNIIYFFVYVLVSAAGIEAIRRVVDKDKLKIKDTFSVAVKKYWKFLALSIILAFIVGLGFVLLIIPGIMFMVWYTFSQFVLIEDSQTKVLASLGKSKNLVKGKFWAIFGRLFVFGLFSLLLQVVISLVPYNLGSVLVVLFGVFLILPNYLLYREITD